MEALKFTLSGPHAFFKKPEVNAKSYFTYGQIHKPVLLGIFGAILGYNGYNQTDWKNEKFPEYYEKLQGLNVAVVPNTATGSFPRKMQTYTNGCGGSMERGGSMQIREQWLDDPSWDIYILLDQDEAEKLADTVLNFRSVFLPYLGQNSHPAEISNPKVTTVHPIPNGKTRIQSLFPLHAADILPESQPKYFYQEYLPTGLNADTTLYEMDLFCLTDAQMAWENSPNLYQSESGSVLFFR